MASARGGKIAVQAYRYGTRRLQHALQTGEPISKGLHGSRPGMWSAFGLVIGGLMLAGCAVYGILKPAPSIGNATVVVDSDSGAAYVITDGVIHPAMNLTSAVLAAAGDGGSSPATSGGSGQAAGRGQAQKQTTGLPGVARADATAINKLPRGALIGIPGAPATLPTAAKLLPDAWAVCDVLEPSAGAPPTMPSKVSRAAYVGVTIPGDVDLATDRAALVTADRRTIYLVMDGHRVALGSTDKPWALDALGIDARQARPVSLSLLNSIPEMAALNPDPVPGAGTERSLGKAQVKVGDVVRANRASTSDSLYVVLKDGVQSVSRVQADLLRAKSGQQGDAPTIDLSDISSQPVSSVALGLDGLPSTWPRIVGPQEMPGLCLSWQHDGARITRTTVGVSSMPSPSGGSLVDVPPTAKNVRTPELVDRVFVPRGRGLVIGQSVDGVSVNADSLFLIGDQGIAYPIVDAKANTALGYQGKVQAGAPELVQLLPRGPILDPVAARKVYTDAPEAQGAASP